MIQGTCHCGAVSFQATPNDRFLVDCNCSICRRLGTIWLHAPQATVTVNAPPGSTIAYTHGHKKTIAFHSCKTCGCTTHWQHQNDPDMKAVNMRLAPPDEIADLPLKHFDGAETWSFLD